MNTSGKIILAGGTGTMGQILQRHFADQGHEVVVLTRRPTMRQHPQARMVHWDARTSGPWTLELEGALAVIGLAGKSVDCRYTAKNKAAIIGSRVNATRALGKAIAQCARPPGVWINLSSATVYRHAEDRPMDESTGELADDFSPQVVKAWEKEFFAHEQQGVRQVAVRSTMVLSRRGGVLPRLRQLVAAGLGGHHGDGRQYVSWVHEHDVARFFQWLIDDPQVQGVINLAAPNPVTDHDLMRELRARLKPWVAIAQPRWLLAFGAVLLRTEPELILKSRRVVPTKAERLGFTFQHPQLAGALDDLIGQRRRYLDR